MAKKILILDTGKEWGGGTNSLIELVKRVDRKRYDLSALFYTNYPKGQGSDVGAELARLGVDFNLLEGRPPALGTGAKMVREAGRAMLFFSREKKRDFVFSRDYAERILPDADRIARFIDSRGFDLLYLNNQPSSNLEGMLAAERLGIPCVQHSRVNIRLNPVEAEAVNRAVSRVICVSEGVRKTLVESGVAPEKCVVVYNGIDPGLVPERDPAEVRREFGIPEGVFVAGTVGSLIKRKRVDLAVKAVSKVRESGVDVRCLVVGTGPELEDLRALAARLGVSDHVVFAGFRTDPLDLISAMDAFVFTTEKEGFPRVVLESMLLARPVAAFGVAGVDELVEDGRTGLLVPDPDVAALARAVAELAGDPERARAMGEAGRKKVVEGFGIERYAAGVMEVFGEVVP